MDLHLVLHPILWFLPFLVLNLQAQQYMRLLPPIITSIRPFWQLKKLNFAKNFEQTCAARTVLLQQERQDWKDHGSNNRHAPPPSLRMRILSDKPCQITVSGLSCLHEAHLFRTGIYLDYLYGCKHSHSPKWQPSNLAECLKSCICSWANWPQRSLSLPLPGQSDECNEFLCCSTPVRPEAQRMEGGQTLETGKSSPQNRTEAQFCNICACVWVSGSSSIWRPLPFPALRPTRVWAKHLCVNHMHCSDSQSHGDVPL